MEQHSFVNESVEPGRMEKIKRMFGVGTLHIVGMEDRSQTEQRLLKAFIETPEVFTVLPSAEAPLIKYERNKF